MGALVEAVLRAVLRAVVLRLVLAVVLDNILRDYNLTPSLLGIYYRIHSHKFDEFVPSQPVAAWLTVISDGKLTSSISKVMGLYRKGIHLG